MYHPLSKIYITQKFGENPKIYYPAKGHNGIDYRTRFVDSLLGKRKMYSPCRGVVIEVGDQGSKGYGKFVRIRDGVYEHVLGHFSSISAKKGTLVKMGETLGITGSTGMSTGPHVHWGVRKYSSKGIVNANNGYYGYFDQLPLIGKAEVVERTGMYLKPSNKSRKVKIMNPGDKFTIYGVVVGQLIDGVEIWFKTSTGNYIWAGKLR